MINVGAEGTSFARSMSAVAQQQYPFALALALTRTAEEAVQEEIKELPRIFVIRNQWVAKGWRVKRATKADPVAEVQHKDASMYLQEVGGEKKALNAKTVALPGPFRDGSGARKNIRDTTPRSKWPSRVNRRVHLEAKGLDFVYSRTGRRTGRHVPHAKPGQGQKRGPGFRDPKLKLMYVMKQSVKVKPRLGARARVQRTVNARFAVNLDGFIAHAMRTAR